MPLPISLQTAPTESTLADLEAAVRTDELLTGKMLGIQVLDGGAMLQIAYLTNAIIPEPERQTTLQAIVGHPPAPPDGAELVWFGEIPLRGTWTRVAAYRKL